MHGLVVNHFSGFGIYLDVTNAGQDTVQNCYIGTVCTLFPSSCRLLPRQRGLDREPARADQFPRTPPYSLSANGLRLFRRIKYLYA